MIQTAKLVPFISLVPVVTVSYQYGHSILLLAIRISQPLPPKANYRSNLAKGTQWTNSSATCTGDELDVKPFCLDWRRVVVLKLTPVTYHPTHNRTLPPPNQGPRSRAKVVPPGVYQPLENTSQPQQEYDRIRIINLFSKWDWKQHFHVLDAIVLQGKTGREARQQSDQPPPDVPRTMHSAIPVSGLRLLGPRFLLFSKIHHYNGAGKGRTISLDCALVGIEGFPTWVIKDQIHQLRSVPFILFWWVM
ncbi:hypothetical protein FCM35_KLT05835 [Carex littledalei]|uniref:Uncharacterized protein n=1 Tax=Carex littledalei TaxID=544730 RepID=A0A833QYH7_9POAL|nr:hypothetical protein FCM35_KLT05835 [Carex littledalei]